MKFIIMLSLAINLIACTSSSKHNLVSSQQTPNHEIQEELISTHEEPAATKKKVKVTRPGLITDKTANTLTDTLIGFVVDTKIDTIDSEKDKKSAEQLHEAYRKSH